MSLTNCSNVCRTCLSQNINIKPIFSMEPILEEQLTLCDMLMICASVTIFKDDGLPENICLNCIEELRKAFCFKRMCEKSDTTLRNCISIVAPVIVQVDTNFENEDVKSSFNLDHKLTVEATSWDEQNMVLADTLDDGISVKSNDENYEDNLKKESVLKSESYIRENRRKRKSYNCEECNEECLGLASYWKHMASVHGKNFKCENCGKE
jgi:hypothetical protein